MVFVAMADEPPSGPEPASAAQQPESSAIPPRPRSSAGMRALLGVIVLIAVGFVLSQWLLVPRTPADPVEYSRVLFEAGLERKAALTLGKWATRHPDSVEAQYDFITLTLRRKSVQRRYRLGDDDRLFRIYELLPDSSQHQRDVATYSRGLCWSIVGEPARAMALFDSVADRELPYLNNSKGVVSLQLGMTAQADSLFRTEIRLGHNLWGAVQNLAEAYVARRDWSRLGALLADRHTATYVPAAARRALLLHERRLGSYLLEFLAAYRMPFRGAYVLVALFCGLIWFLLVRWWDLFEKEPVALCVLVVLAGALATNGTVLFHDLLSQFAKVGPSKWASRDFLFFFAVVGIVEEVLKLAPVALVMLIPGRINEPLDWVVYACLSALGFSVLENYHYLFIYGFEAGLGRVFFTTPFHLSLTGMIAMFIAEARLRGENPLRWLIPGLFVVAGVHGAFDFFMDWDDGTFAILGMVLAVLWGAAFIECVGILGSASPFRDRLGPARYVALPWFVAAFLLLCFGIYLLNSTRLPHDLAASVFASDLTPNLEFVLVLWIYTRLRIRSADAPLPVDWRMSPVTREPAISAPEAASKP
jgi:RsiW-degrading membrane proteinase PrsW (M82 family)